jgi:hypothetical protein
MRIMVVNWGIECPSSLAGYEIVDCTVWEIITVAGRQDSRVQPIILDQSHRTLRQPGSSLTHTTAPASHKAEMARNRPLF